MISVPSVVKSATAKAKHKNLPIKHEKTHQNKLMGFCMVTEISFCKQRL